MSRARTGRGERGMTLIEIGVALAVAALMMAVAIPAIASVTRAQLRQKSGQLSGAIRSLYGAAALQGHTCRLVLDLDARAYWSECAKGNVGLAPGERSQNGARLDDDRLRDLRERNREDLSDEDRARLQLADKSAFTPSSDVPRTELPSSVKFSDVWVQHQPERYVAGTAFLYFWSSGLTESAAIHLQQGDDVVSLLVSPLTGRVKLAGTRVNAPGEPQ